jgi:hypothetical protein
MKKQILIIISVGSILSITACSNNPHKDEPGVKVERGKGGEMKIDKDQLKIEGKNGGQLKIDSNGAKVERPQHN